METVDSTLDTLKTVRADLDRYERVREIVARQGNSPARLIPILREIQDQFHYLPEDLLEFLSGLLEIPAARVYGVATFYTHFSLEPRGRHIIQVCDGTACHVKRSESLIQAMRERLGLKAGQRTSEDLSFSLETVSCLGACGLAPVIVVDGTPHGQMTPEACVKLIDNILAAERAAQDSPAEQPSRITGQEE